MIARTGPESETAVERHDAFRDRTSVQRESLFYALSLDMACFQKTIMHSSSFDCRLRYGGVRPLSHPPAYLDTTWTCLLPAVSALA